MVTIALLSCSTEKNTFVNRNFHNLTAHYNVYFNGNEAMKSGLYKIETQIEEDYTKVLPIFKESLPGTEKTVIGDMSIAIEKGTKLIKFHSISAAPESNKKKDVRKRKTLKPEYNKWVDKAYMMIGQAYLYQKNHIMAASTFSLIIRKFKSETVKYDAYVWLARTYNESGRYTEARDLIETLEGDNNFPEKLEGELAIIAADLYLKQNQYDEAIQYLNIGIKKIKGNKRKTRYNFILAQLYQEQGNNPKALEAYQRVIRRRPNYDMLFNARINSAGVFSGDGNISSLRKELTKMSKKQRNQPYLDQIYYALANILYNENRIDDAVKLYRQSAAVSVKNTHQRALSCLTLADIYFDRKTYIPSGNYYDSAMVLIDNNYPNFKAIEQKHRNLSRLVKNLVAVETQDSLQHLASLSPEELNAKINKWISIEKKKIEDMTTAMSSGEYSGAYGQSMNNRMRVKSTGSWYFYNPSTVAFGKQEFSRLWGDRPNEDHWRRSNKSISLLNEMGEPIAGELDELIEEEEEKLASDPTTKEYYIQNIPNNDSLMTISNNIIRNALYEAGTIFKTDFNDFERSIESFNDLNFRYPDNTFELPSFFNLWDLYKIVEKPDSSTIFKNKILNKYPESNYAKYLLNPNYFLELEAQKDSMNNLYAQAFNSYRDRDFNKAREYSSMVLSMEPDSILIPKARFIQMVSTARFADQKQFADSLSTFISQYPTSEPTPLAKQIFDLIKTEKLSDYKELVNTGYLNEAIKNLELIAESQKSSNEVNSKWDIEKELLHYFIIAYPNTDSVDVNRLRFDIANYNIDHFTTLDFDIETETLNKDTRLIVVRNFANKEASLIYFLSIIRKPEVFKTLAGQKFFNFVISNNNYREMLSDRSYDQYLQYFVKNYSIFTTGEFLEEELESPEELMAKLARGDDELVEQGEFVIIGTDDKNYKAPEAKKEIFTADYNVPHSYVVMINEPRFTTGFLMRDIVRYNSDKHRDKRLRVVPANLTNATLMMVSVFENAYLAGVYQKEADSNKGMFESLRKTAYKSFIISNENFNKLKETNDIKAWESFYQKNYIKRKPQAPKVDNVEEKTETKAPETLPVQVPEKLAPKTDAIPTEATDVLKNEASDNTSEPEAENENSVTTDTLNTSRIPAILPVEVSTAANVASETEDTNTIKPEEKATPPALAEPASGSYEGPYDFDANAPHNLIYLLPSSGSNKTLLLTYLTRLNAINYRGSDIKVSEIEFDEYRSLVVVSGLTSLEQAKLYLKTVESDNRVGMSLRNVNYKSYLISNNNLDIFKKEKNINSYQNFYTSFY